MLIVGTDQAAVEADLKSGRLSCPGCQVGLRPWGHGVDREVRLLARSEQRCFRRSICRPCRATHVLIPEDTLVRRRHGTFHQNRWGDFLLVWGLPTLFVGNTSTGGRDRNF